MPEWASTPRAWTSCLTPSARRRAPAWGSGSPSAALSSRGIMAVSGRSRMTAQALRSRFPFPRIERLQQSRLAEGFEQALHGTLFEQAWPEGLISQSGDEDDRDLFPAKRQFPLEIRPGHARHGNVEDQASGLAGIVGRQEFFRRRERLGRKAERPQQVG